MNCEVFLCEMSGNSRSSSVSAKNVPPSVNRRSSFHTNSAKKKTLSRRASISADPSALKENARKRAEERRLAEIERQKQIRKRNALSRKLDFDPEMMRVKPGAVHCSSSGSLSSLTPDGRRERCGEVWDFGNRSVAFD